MCTVAAIRQSACVLLKTTFRSEVVWRLAALISFHAAAVALGHCFPRPVIPLRLQRLRVWASVRSLSKNAALSGTKLIITVLENSNNKKKNKHPLWFRLQRGHQVKHRNMLPCLLFFRWFDSDDFFFSLQGDKNYCGSDTDSVRGKFQSRSKSQAIYLSLLWINKPPSLTKTPCASCLLLAIHESSGLHSSSASRGKTLHCSHIRSGPS